MPDLSRRKFLASAAAAAVVAAPAAAALPEIVAAVAASEPIVQTYPGGFSVSGRYLTLQDWTARMGPRNLELASKMLSQANDLLEPDYESGDTDDYDYYDDD